MSEEQCGLSTEGKFAAVDLLGHVAVVLQPLCTKQFCCIVY